MSDIFEPYDDLAVDVIINDVPNTDVDLQLSNAQLVESVCQMLGVEDVDLFEERSFRTVVVDGTATECLANSFVAFLRWRLFTTASAEGIGNEEFNQRAAAHSEYWYIKLAERWNALSGGDNVKKWVN